jgi:predicted nucleic acid-binding protein
MVLIYHFESHEELGPAAAELLRATEDGRCRLVASMVGRFEVLVAPMRHGRDDLCRRYREVFDGFPNFEVVPIDTPIVEIASDLRAAHNLRTPDALHLAAAIHRGADAFVTEDDRHFPAEAEDVPILSIRSALARLGEAV